MPSRSSSSHPKSLHPYRNTRSQSTTSLQTTTSTKKKSWMSRFILKTRREGLLPLPEGARLSSPSPPPELLTLSHISLELPHLARMPDLPPVSGDSTWAETLDLPDRNKTQIAFNCSSLLLVLTLYKLVTPLFVAFTHKVVVFSKYMLTHLW